MLSKVIRKSVPLIGVCKSYGKNICGLQNGLPTNFKLAPCQARFVSTSFPVLSSKPVTKEQVKEASGEKPDVKDVKAAESEAKDDSAEKSEPPGEKEKKGLPTQTEFESEREKEKRRDQEWRKHGRYSIISAFAATKNKNKDTFLECLRMYANSPGKKVDRVLFIYTALKHMEDFGVHKDLQVYKAILDVFPKQTMVPTNIFQTWFMHYAREQYCAVALFEQMENNAVMPDPEMETLVLSIFGSHGLPTQKYWKMMYWMPKFRHKNPWPVPNPIPDDPFELAKLAMFKISSIDVTSTITVYQTEDVEDSIDKTWIVSAMAPKQRELLKKHVKNQVVYVEGPFKIYVATKSVDYFILRADPSPNRKFPDIDTDAVDKIVNPYVDLSRSKELMSAPCVHEEEDATIFAICATGTSTKDSLLSWVRCLQKSNPVLGEIPIVFTLKNKVRENYYIPEGDNAKKETPFDVDTRAS